MPVRYVLTAGEGTTTESVVIYERIIRLARRRRGGEIGDAVYASLYFLCWQTALHGRRCAARKHRRDPRPDALAWWDELRGMDDEEARERLLHYLQRYGFLEVIANVPAALCAWLRGQWPLTLCEHIPDPEEVLRMQVRGTRPVTILREYPRLFQPVLNKANAYAFMVHDLEHAYKYFHDAELHRGQKGFFTAIERMLRQGVLDNYRRDSSFAGKFAYLIGDMNTHAEHSVQFLRAILVEYHLRREHKPPAGVLSTQARAAIEAIMRTLFALMPKDMDRWAGNCLCTCGMQSSPDPP
jgi:hypothetical protein